VTANPGASPAGSPASPPARTKLAEFLRTSRTGLSPAQAGLGGDGHGHGQRRTPGLRRQEVAQLAGISVDYYIRLEQARGPHPSRQVLTSLARALMLTADEREYLFKITGQTPPAVASPSRELTPAVRYLLDGLREVPAYVVDAKYDILAWNTLATHFIGDLSTFTEEARVAGGGRSGRRNMLRWMFTHGDNAVHWSDPDSVAFARSLIADLRASRASYPGDRGIGNLVTELLAVSATFAAMWREHDVEVRRRVVKRFVHPQVGPLEFECQVLHIPEGGQRLIVYCAAPDSPTQHAFRQLARTSSTNAQA
jgi:transcriptional regulator with XRE-family HTH domain